MVSYSVDVSWDFLKKYVAEHVEDFGLDLDPDFQRGHVWTREQQIAYVEFCLRGGKSASALQFNCPGWHNGRIENYVLVDGKQRLTAILAFLNDEIPAFGHLYSAYAGTLRIHRPSVKWCINDLETRAQVLNWYLEMNTGGTVHSQEEISRVRQLLVDEEKRANPEVHLCVPCDNGSSWTLEKKVGDKTEKATINAVTAEALRRHGVAPLEGVSGAFDRYALDRAIEAKYRGFKLSKKAKRLLGVECPRSGRSEPWLWKSVRDELRK